MNTIIGGISILAGIFLYILNIPVAMDYKKKLKNNFKKDDLKQYKTIILIFTLIGTLSISVGIFLLITK